MQNKKTRYDSITVTTGKGTEFITLSANAEGIISFGETVSNAHFERTYERTGKGDKVTCRIPQDGSGPYRLNIEDIVSNIEHLFAVDTNTDCIDGRKLSVVAFLRMRRVFFVNSFGVAKALHLFQEMHCLECYDILPPQENFGWKYSLAYIFEELGIKKDIALVVDSDLGNLSAYNSRLKPFYGSCYLPSGVTLIYASSDSDKGNTVNAAISCADKAASDVKRALKNGYPPQDGRLWRFP
ncbi:MAG TPA: hypothetical protein PK694_03060 [Rhodospirillales bacterium]|jgi:hypothetical protein|nr:hypothetical protein [Rhodospirillales bacterium]